MVCAERKTRERRMEKRDRESNRAESHGKKREDSRNRLTSAEGERRRWRIVGATTVRIYFHSAAGSRKRQEKGGRWEEAKRGRRCRCASTTGA